MYAQFALEFGFSVKVIEPAVEFFPLLKPPLACVAPRANHPPDIHWLRHEAGKEFIVHGLSDEGALEDGASARRRFFSLFVYTS